MSDSYLWWQYGLIYQIYPRSFQDSNDDGVGDIKGIISRLDYLKGLGIKAIWLSPIFPSPMADFGYDVSDYINVHPLFGDLQDVNELISEVHSRDMKLIFDLVPNHTSDQHPWFIESRSSKDNPKRDWYLWKDAGPDGGAPNNWLAAFGGSGWEWDATTDQFYYHAFLKEQPDLNWRNPEVQQAMYAVMRFWLSKGIDGFRIDVLWHLIKDAAFRDNPVNPSYNSTMSTYDKLMPIHSTDQPEVHEIVKQMRAVLNSYTGRVMIGEIYLPVKKLVTYYGAHQDEAHLPFNFELILMQWESDKIASMINDYEAELPAGGWPNWVLGNHDQVRISSRVGAEQAKVAALLLLTLRGTPTLYYGDEIGMKDVPISRQEMCDPQGLNMPDKNLSRDPGRTPMQWDRTPLAGFSNTRPWLPLDRHRATINTAVQEDDPNSMLVLYRRLIRLRNAQAALSVGSYAHVYSDHQSLSYIREWHGSDSYLIVLNLTHRTCYFNPKDNRLTGIIEISTSPELEGTSFNGIFNLSGDEALVVRLTVKR